MFNMVDQMCEKLLETLHPTPPGEKKKKEEEKKRKKEIIGNWNDVF